MRYKQRVVLGGCALCIGLAFSQVQADVVSFNISDSTTTWTPITYPNNNNPDPSNDQQTGSEEGDVVGNVAHPSVYTIFANAGTPSLTDGTLGFRIRLGADANPPGFKGAAFVGIDANGDGALDLFIGVNNSGTPNQIGLWNPGNGLNTSPSTTTIASTPLVSYTETGTNYLFVPVTTTNDPTVGTATDIDGGGQNDYFLSFSVPFSDVVTQLSLNGVTNFNQNTSLSYVIATSTQGNSLNQDLNGVPKTYDASATWASLGAQSVTFNSAGTAVPEPSSLSLMVLGILVVAGIRQYRSTASKGA